MDEVALAAADHPSWRSLPLYSATVASVLIWARGLLDGQRAPAADIDQIAARLALADAYAMAPPQRLRLHYLLGCCHSLRDDLRNTLASFDRARGIASELHDWSAFAELAWEAGSVNLAAMRLMEDITRDGPESPWSLARG